MKIIIDISQATQKIIHDHGEVGIHMSAENLLEAITDSTPLDNLRAEIEFEVDHRTNMLCAEDVFAILDKYKTESEVKE